MDKTTKQIEEIYNKIVGEFNRSNKTEKALGDILLKASKEYDLHTGEAAEMEKKVRKELLK